MVHGVAGVEGAGQAGIRAIEDVEGGRYCDFHAPPWWHCGQSHKLVRILADKAREGAKACAPGGERSGAELGQLAGSLMAEIRGWGGVGWAKLLSGN